jgi:hypothetical protein
LCPLFLLQEQRRLLAQYWNKTFRCLCQEPRQRQLDAQRLVEHGDRSLSSLGQRAHSEAQCIAFPNLLVDRDHRPELTVGAREAFFETAHSLRLAETMLDYECDGIAHAISQLTRVDVHARYYDLPPIAAPAQVTLVTSLSRERPVLGAELARIVGDRSKVCRSSLLVRLS